MLIISDRTGKSSGVSSSSRGAGTLAERQGVVDRAVPVRLSPMRALTGVVRQLFEDGWAEGLRKCGQALPMLLNLKEHRQYTRLINRPNIAPLFQKYPRLNFKYLGNSLSLRFSTRKRLQATIFHYEYLDRRIRPDFLGRLFDAPQTVWSAELSGKRYAIELCFPHPDDQEGDLGLTFLEDRFPLYQTTFSVCSGALLQVPPPAVLFVARMQGGGERYALIRGATQACHDISPADMLMAALQGVAAAFDVRAMVGIGRACQVSGFDDRKASAFFDYDGFWLSYRAEITRNELYLMRLPFGEKPIEMVKPKHRSRTLRKRHFKHELKESVRLHCENQFLKPQPLR